MQKLAIDTEMKQAELMSRNEVLTLPREPALYLLLEIMRSS